MNISLDSHQKGYALNRWDAVAIVAGGFSGLPLALRHFQQGYKPQESKWHFVIGGLELIPGIGLVVSLIDFICARVLRKTEEAHITECITSIDQIPRLASINGISIEEIEKRARPAIHPNGPNKTVENEGWSYSGFLGMDESFKDVLLADWKSVQALGWTHAELASHLDAIQQRLEQDCDTGQELHFTYEYSKNGQVVLELTGVYVPTRGRQEDIFKPAGASYGWSRGFHLMNPSNGAKVQWGKGQVAYIRKYGFYEGGGKGNEYRVDPVTLIALLTGKGTG